MRIFAKVSVVFVVMLLMQCMAFFTVRVKAQEFSYLNYPDNWCLNFDGIDDYVYCGVSQVFRPQNITVEAWIKPKYNIMLGSDALYGHQWAVVIACQVYTGAYVTTGGWWLQFDYANGPLYFCWRYNSYYVWDSLAYPTNKAVWYNTSWYHIAVTFNPTLPGDNLKFYVNGTLDSQHTDSHAIRYGGTIPFHIGGSGGNNYTGLVDEVRVWNISRVASDIQDTMPRILNTTEIANPNLVGYWRFDEGTGTISNDYSLQDNDAVLAPTPATPQWDELGAPIIPELSAFSLIVSMIAVSSFAAIILYIRKQRRVFTFQR